jgi:damage-control phosphatase, subfamily I
MKTSLDCIPCFLRQSLEATRLASTDPILHEKILRDVLRWAGEMDFDQSPPAMAQRIHRQLRQITGVDDPYLQAKDKLNSFALELIPGFKSEVESADDPLLMAVRLAIAGNMMDMGVGGSLIEADVRQTMKQALTAPFFGKLDKFRQALDKAQSILYLADNAGEIAFDRLLVEQLLPKHVTVAVRGAPVINDATLADAQTVGLDKIVEVIDNGSDAPGTIISDCNSEFRHRFADADLIIAKGQGNFETLSSEPANIFFLFKVKCSVIADHIQQPMGMQVLIHSDNHPALFVPPQQRIST